MPVVKPVERVKGSKGRKVAKFSETGREILDSNKTVIPLRGRVVQFELSG